MTRRLREAWTDAVCLCGNQISAHAIDATCPRHISTRALFPVRDLDLLQPPPASCGSSQSRSLAALRSVATEHDDHELIDAMAPISYRLDGDLAEDACRPPVAVRRRGDGSTPGFDRVRGRRVAGRRPADHAATARAQPRGLAAGAAAGRRAPRPSLGADRGHRRRRQQTEAAHRRALARLAWLRLPDDNTKSARRAGEGRPKAPERGAMAQTHFRRYGDKRDLFAQSGEADGAP